jgi:hypothetical protein
MNVARITMDREQARTKLRALRKQLHRRADAEYQALEAGYLALTEGKAVISLTAAIENGGFDAKGRPRLAIARADRLHVRVEREGMVCAFDTSRGRRGGRRSVVGLRWSASMIVETVLHNAPRAENWRVTGYALVPIVPAEAVALVRGSSNLRYFYTLFEVEAWSDSPVRAVPDRDPFLLRHLEGDLYSIVAEWDLTELERAVMLGRRDA